jgi:SAM-dependent methyltransferase
MSRSDLNSYWLRFLLTREANVPAKENIENALVQLLQAEKAATSSDQSRQYYVDVHRARFADILRLCRKYVPDASARVLDIGRSELTAYLLKFYRNITTMGLDPSIDDGGHREMRRMETVPHITFDLLNSHCGRSWPECGSFDLIVFSEVIEHLHVAPEFVLACLRSLLAEGGVLVCTTPNAADIAKRLRLTFGRNPYERLRLYSINPGHIREYTRQELCEIAHSVGLSCVRHSYFSWPQSWNGSRIKAAIMKLIRIYPPFRTGQLAIFRTTIPVMVKKCAASGTSACPIRRSRLAPTEISL